MIPRKSLYIFALLGLVLLVRPAGTACAAAMGPDMPGLSAILAPAQAIWFDTVHKGTPDSSREQLNARTHDFAMEIWTKASLALTERPNGTPEKVKALDRASRLQARADRLPARRRGRIEERDGVRDR